MTEKSVPTENNSPGHSFRLVALQKKKKNNVRNVSLKKKNKNIIIPLLHLHNFKVRVVVFIRQPKKKRQKRLVTFLKEY